MSALVSHAQQAAGSISYQLQRTAGSVGTQLQTTTDKIFPPQDREVKLKYLRSFSTRNPKLATFLAAQTALLGVPLLLFILFAISTLFVSLATCILFAVSAALFYTFFAVGIAFLFLIPTLFVASFAASCFFLWGLVVYLILQRFNDGEAPGKPGTRVGDKLHGLTGGRLDWMVEGEETKAVGMSDAPDRPLRNGSNGVHEGRSASRQGGDRTVNAAGEWEDKWAQGSRHRLNEFANGLDVKADEFASDSCT